MTDAQRWWERGQARRALAALGDGGDPHLRARCLLDLDEPAAAAAALRGAPEGRDTWLLRARCGGPDAVAAARRAVAGPDDVEAMTVLGAALIDRGQLAAARTILDAVVASRRKDAAVADALGHLGRVAWQQDAIAAAVQRFHQAAVAASALGRPRAEARWRAWLDRGLMALHRAERRLAEMVPYLEVVRRMEEPRWEAAILLDRARCLDEIGSVDAAAGWQEAHAACVAAGDARGVTEAEGRLSPR